MSMKEMKSRSVRRRNLMHPRLRSRMSSRRSLSKSNPYVGSFRHSPPTTTMKISSCASILDNNMILDRRLTQHKMYRLKTLGMKNCPYTGWFRHAPPSLDFGMPTDEHHSHVISSLILSLHHSLIIDATAGRKGNLVDGKLKGGSPAWLDKDAIQRSLKETSMASPSATVQVLSRLATWLLSPMADQDPKESSFAQHRADPFVNEQQLQFPQKTLVDAGITDDELSIGEESEDCSVYSDGTHLFPDDLPSSSSSPISPPCFPVDSLSQTTSDRNNETTSSSRPPLQSSLSSLAEAYYAYQAASEVQHNETADNDARLDYIITQMDISRMARNASRHLDVESIFNLPTITYREDDQYHLNITTQEEGDDDDSQETSWMLVPPMQEKEKEKESQICVICLEPFNDGDRLRVLPCNHTFHCGCVDKWLSGSHSFDECYTSGCPTCKKRPEVENSSGNVPSWAFCRLGDSLANSSVST